jgi:hypothetical protein
MKPKTKPETHPHADKIHAWAEGYDIQKWDYRFDEWVDDKYPTFLPEIAYRVKLENRLEPADLEAVRRLYPKGKCIVMEPNGRAYLCLLDAFEADCGEGWASLNSHRIPGLDDYMPREAWKESKVYLKKGGER